MGHDAAVLLADTAAVLDAGHDAATVLDGRLDTANDVVPDGGAETGSDSGPANTCTTAADCTGLAPGPVLPHCASSYWSCLRPVAGQPGRCARECMNPPRTCVPSGGGCIVCDAPGSQPSCPGQVCPLAARPFVIEGTSCPTTPSFDLGTCRGDWLLRSDGTACAIQELPTGAIRFAIACPECTTIVMQL